MKYIFVEGPDDKNFVETIINKNIDFKIFEYAVMKSDKINKMIKSFNSMGEEYIVLADLDEKDKEIRINEVLERFGNIERERIFFSIQEIESWYLSGISEKYTNKYKVKTKILSNTEKITKEKFQSIFKNTRDSIEIVKLNLLEEFDIENAKSRNESLRLFLENAI